MVWHAGKPATDANLESTPVRENFAFLKAEKVERQSSNTTTVGNLGAGEDVLISQVLAAGLLGLNGMAIRGLFAGRTANNANAKTLRVRLKEGAANDVIHTFVLTINEAGRWVLDFQVMRTGAATGRCITRTDVGPSGGPVSKSGTDSSLNPSVTWANAVTVEVTGQATADNDITVESGNLVLF